MNNNNQHIDPLQKALQQRFKDFEFDVELNVDKILAESAVKPGPKTANPAGLSKYYFAAGAVVTTVIIAYFLFRTDDQVKQPVAVPAQVELLQIAEPAENIKEDTAPVAPAITETKQLKTIKKSVSSKKRTPLSNPVENITAKHDSVPAVKEHKEIRTANFDDFIKHKAKQSKDSLELFKHKK